MSEGKADFFFVGYPKSGSTTFYYLLKTHPEFFAPEIKEPKFFSSDFNRELEKNLGNDYFQLIRSEKDYNKLFNGGAGKITGDFNPFNILSVDAPRNILNYNPEAKILISIREPVSFLRSFHFQSLYRMIEDEPDFLKALSLEESRRANKNIPKYCHNPLYLFYSSLVEYKTHIKRFTDVFGCENVKVVLFDDVLKDEYAVYRDILRFLNANDMDYAPPKPDRNPSHALRFKWLRSMLFSPPVKKWLYANIPLRLFPVAARISQRTFKKEQEKPFVPVEDIVCLKKRYRPNVDELTLFLNQTGLVNQDIARLWDY